MCMSQAFSHCFFILEELTKDTHKNLWMYTRMYISKLPTVKQEKKGKKTFWLSLCSKKYAPISTKSKLLPLLATQSFNLKDSNQISNPSYIKENVPFIGAFSTTGYSKGALVFGFHNLISLRRSLNCYSTSVTSYHRRGLQKIGYVTIALMLAISINTFPTRTEGKTWQVVSMGSKWRGRTRALTMMDTGGGVPATQATFRWQDPYGPYALQCVMHMRASKVTNLPI